MEFSHTLIGSAALKSAIDHDPLLVSPHTPLLEVMAQMSQAQGNNCGLVHDGLNDGHSKDVTGVPPIVDQDSPTVSRPSHHAISTSPRQSSCVLIVDQDTSIGLNEQQVVGIFTERDIVKLVAEGVALDSLTIGEAMVSPVISLAQSEFQDIFAPLFLFRRYQIRHLLIVDDCDRPIGIVSPESIRTVLRPANLLKLRRVSDIMAHDVICADYQVSVLKTAQLMTEHRVSCVVITEQDDDRGVLPIGIVTERDIVQFRTLELDLSIQVGTVMSSPLCLLKPDDSLWTAHQEMQRLRVRRLVVSWNWGKGLGIVTQTSLLRVFDPLEMYSVLETLQTTLQHLQSEKRLSSTFSDSPTLEIDSTPPSLPALSLIKTEATDYTASPPHSAIRSSSLSAQDYSAQDYLAQLLQGLQRLESTVAELPLAESDRPQKDNVLSDVKAILDITRHLEQLLSPTQKPPSISIASDVSQSEYQL